MMTDNVQQAALMLREAADFFATLAPPTQYLAQQLQRMARAYRIMANALEADPLGPVPEELA
jgi:hypothetical protein